MPPINVQSSPTTQKALNSHAHGISRPLPSGTPVLVQQTHEHVVYGGTCGVYAQT